MSLKDSDHFVDSNDILNVEGLTNFRDLYDSLSTHQNGGGFFIEIDGVNNYVKAAPFAADVLRRAVAEVILGRGLSDEEAEGIRSKVAEITRSSVASLVREIIEDLPVVPVHGQPALLTADEQPLRDQPDLVFEVQDGAEKIGWYLNHETVRETTTQKIVFVCSNTPSHDNSSADNGTCGQCPWPIVGSRKL